jgi:predicted anti-sigma-YlaC factor YlaD
VNRVTCQDVVELVTAYLEDALSIEDRAAFEEHLLICEGCVRYLQQMSRTIELVGEVREESLSPQTRQGLLDAFADWKRSVT